MAASTLTALSFAGRVNRADLKRYVSVYALSHRSPLLNLEEAPDRETVANGGGKCGGGLRRGRGLGTSICRLTLQERERKRQT